jgi:ankyrin repeat protein
VIDYFHTNLSNGGEKMKHERFLCVVVMASVFLFLAFGSDVQGDSARKELEKRGIEYSESSFVECAKKGDIDAVKLFLDEGMNINAANKRGQTALIRAAEYQQGEVVTMLLENGAVVDKVGGRYARTPLMEAAGTGNCVIIKQLVQKGADINAKDYESNTPLHFACMYGHIEAVRLLIGMDAKPDVQASGLGRTPMKIAETNGYTEIVQILKDAGAKK